MQYWQSGKSHRSRGHGVAESAPGDVGGGGMRAGADFSKILLSLQAAKVWRMNILVVMNSTLRMRTRKRSKNLVGFATKRIMDSVVGIAVVMERRRATC